MGQPDALPCKNLRLVRNVNRPENVDFYRSSQVREAGLFVEIALFCVLKLSDLEKAKDMHPPNGMNASKIN